MLPGMRRAAAFLLVLAGTAVGAPSKQSESTPHPGIHRETWVDSSVPVRIEVVRIDLTSAEIAVYATKESDRGITTTAYSDRIGAQVAVNGDGFYVAGPYRPRGLAIGDSAPWTNTADTAALPLLHVRRVGERTEAVIDPPEVVSDPATLPAGTQGAVGGGLMLVRAGIVEPAAPCADAVTLPCQKTPRTAVGLTADGNTLIIAVVDGWQAASLGMSATELAQFMSARGAANAMALDGGSSSTLVLDGALKSIPSDGPGIERKVANHLGVKYGALPRGELVGLICKTSIVQCGNNTSLRISGATVTLDDTRTQPSDANGFYDFTGVTPRLACVTVKKTGYKTKHQCQTVDSGITTFNSVVLEPGVDPVVDAGVPDANEGDDASVGGDGGFGRDTTNPEDGPGGGCCDAGRDRSIPRSITLVVLVGWMLSRRRGTKA